MKYDTLTHPALTFDQAFNFLRTYITSQSAPRPVMLWGPPGVGKTALVKRLAAELRRPGEAEQDNLRMFYAAYMEPTDIQGFPVPDHETRTTRFYPLHTLPIEERPEDSPGILFFDELSNARRDVQSVLLEIMRENAVGGRPLPAGWVRIGAGNRVEDAAGSNTMISSLQDRLLHVEIAPDLDESCKHYLVSYPDNLDVSSFVVGFLRFRPETFHRPPLISPRSWDDVIRLLITVGLEPETIQLAGGIVGVPIATEMVAFWEMRSQLPSVKDVMDNPETAPLPDTSGSPGLGYAMAGMLVSALVRDPTRQRFSAAMRYVTRMPLIYSALFVNSVLHALGNKAEEVTADETFTRWLVNNDAMLF